MSGTARDHYDALARALGERAARHQPLGPLTTYGVGGPAALLIEVDGHRDRLMSALVKVDTSKTTSVSEEVENCAPLEASSALICL